MQAVNRGCASVRVAFKVLIRTIAFDLPANVCDYNEGDWDKIVCSSGSPTEIKLGSKLRALFHMRRTGDKKNCRPLFEPEKTPNRMVKGWKTGRIKGPRIGREAEG